MASIIKRRNKYSVIYRYIGEDGEPHQRWETFNTNAEAKKRKAQVEFQQKSNTFIAPTAKTLSDLLEDYVNIYGVNTWAPSTYDGHKGLIDNYIVPLIGDLALEEINPRMMDQFYKKLQTVKRLRPPKDGSPYLTTHIIREIHKLLRNAFNQAVKWELMARNPVAHATLPKEEKTERAIWTEEQMHYAIDQCDNDLLTLQISISFACSLRMGEMLGLTWDCVDVSPDSIKNDCASIFINKELQRITKDSLEQVGERSLIRKFPHLQGSSRHTVLVLKEPKTPSSIRKVYLPRSVAELMVKRQAEIRELKDLLGEEYMDYNLVFCNAGGTPMEGSTVNREFDKLIRDLDLPKVVFHSLRHSSTTYKLKLSGGNIKAVQGDTGHAQATMVTEQYSHIMDEDRRQMARSFEQSFYVDGKPKADDSPVSPSATPADPLSSLDAAEKQALLLKLLADSPEIAALLKTVAQVG